MSKQTINIGASPNDGTGTPLRTSFDYTNQNFTELYTALGGGVGLPGATTQVIFNDGGTNLAGDAGLVYNKTTDTLTAGNASITGDLTVDTSTLKVDSANNRVGIGTATPACKLEVVAPAGDNIVSTFRSGDATAANNAGGGFQSISSATAASRVARVWLDADGADLSGGDYFFIQKNGNSGTVEFNQSSNAAMTFLTNGTERYRIASDGVATWSNVGGVAGTAMTLNSTGNLVFPSAKGIDFSATAGTGTSELLADYEEGTFTATLTGGTTNPTIPVTTTARYTKVGRLVTVQIAFENVSTVGASGTIGITGLPFQNGSVSSTGIATLYNLATYTGSPVAFIDNTVSTIGFFGNVSSSTFSSVTHNAGVAGYSTTTITYSV